jgi:sulfur carrier protein
MRLTLNGEQRDLPELATLTDLIRHLALPEKFILVEKNGEAISRVALFKTPLIEGDTVEIIRMVAGG